MSSRMDIWDFIETVLDGWNVELLATTVHHDEAGQEHIDELRLIDANHPDVWVDLQVVDDTVDSSEIHKATEFLGGKPEEVDGRTVYVGGATEREEGNNGPMVKLLLAGIPVDRESAPRLPEGMRYEFRDDGSMTVIDASDNVALELKAGMSIAEATDAVIRKFGDDAADGLIEQGESTLSGDSDQLVLSETIADQNIDSLVRALGNPLRGGSTADGKPDSASMASARTNRTIDLQRGLLSAVDSAIEGRGVFSRNRLKVADVQTAAEANRHRIRYIPNGGKEITGIQIVENTGDPAKDRTIAQVSVKTPRLGGDAKRYLDNKGAASLSKQLEMRLEHEEWRTLKNEADEQVRSDDATIKTYADAHGGDREGPDGEADHGDPESGGDHDHDHGNDNSKDLRRGRPISL